MLLGSAGQTAQLVSKYRPAMPILTLVIPQLKSDGHKWTLEGRATARQCQISRGLLPVLAAPSPSGELPVDVLLSGLSNRVCNVRRAAACADCTVRELRQEHCAMLAASCCLCCLYPHWGREFIIENHCQAAARLWAGLPHLLAA